MSAVKIVASICNLFFPRYCVLCNQRLTISEHHICQQCFSALPLTQGHYMPGNIMEQSFWGLMPIERATAFFYYSAHEVRTLVHAAKYHKHPMVAQHVTQMMTRDMIPSGFFKSIDAIIPVPIHTMRELKRGYNQSLYIAQGISIETGLPILPHAVMRTRYTDSQTHKNVMERRENMENVFRVVDNKSIKGKHLLLVDDVVTSAATISSLALELTAAGCSKISILSMAYASPHIILPQP